jgi:hypothetical protein
VGPDGSVGSFDWVDSGTVGIQLGYLTHDMTITFPAVAVPVTNWISKPTNTTITNSGYYAMSQISGNMIIVGPTNVNRIDVTLLLTNGINFVGARTLTIGTNAYVTMFVGNTIDVSALAKINNASQHAQQLLIYGLPSLTGISIHGNGPFWGLIYAPNAYMSVNGYGAAGGYYGTFVCYSITCTGTTTFSYDESLDDLRLSLVTAATLNATFNSTNRQFDLTVTGYPGLVYAVQASTNLTDWQSVVTNTAPFGFTETNADAFSQCFYRARCLN